MRFFLILLFVICISFLSIQSNAQETESLDNLVVSKLEMKPEMVEVDGAEVEQRAEIYTAELTTDKDVEIFTEWLEKQYNQDLEANKNLKVVPIEISLDKNRKPDSIKSGLETVKSKLESVMSFFKKKLIKVTKAIIPAKDYLSIEKYIERWKVDDHMERVTLTFVRSTLNGVACTWSFLASKQVPLVVAIPLGILTGGISGTFQWWNTKFGNWLIDSYLLKKIYNIDHKQLEELSKNVKVPKKYLSEKSADEIKKLKKQVALYNFIAKSEEFTKWLSMELVFVSVIKAGVRFGAYIMGTLDKNVTLAGDLSAIGHSAFKGFLAQAGWDLSIAKSNANQKMEVDKDSTLSVQEKETKKYKIQRSTNFKNFVVSISEVTFLCSMLAGHEWGSLGLTVMALGGWSNYLRINYGDRIGEIGKKCVLYLKNKFSYQEHPALYHRRLV